VLRVHEPAEQLLGGSMIVGQEHKGIYIAGHGVILPDGLPSIIS
jgi:hypothetical protein